MSDLTAPAKRPANPRFSSGPCAKVPGFSLDLLADAPLGRSHRAAIGKAKLKEAIDLTREILGVPADYRIGIVPGSDTGAVEMAMWSLLGARPVEMLAWESFGEGWVTDVVKQLKLDAKVKIAPYGQIVDFATVDFNSDVVFTWNGTTSGARLPNADAIPADRQGLTICDATSAAFAMDLDWAKLDVTTFSWQKVLGGEGGGRDGDAGRHGQAQEQSGVDVGDFWTVEQFNIRHWRIVAYAETHFQDAQVTAIAVGVTWAQFSEQFQYHFAVAQTRERQALVGQRGLFSQSDQRLDNATQFLGLRHGGFDGFMTQQGNGHVAQHSQAVGRSTIQLAKAVTVTHGNSFRVV